MKNIFLIFFSLCFSMYSFGQYEITIEAFVLDESTKAPIAYANIGFVDKGIGTVTDEKGYFKLKYDEGLVGSKDILQFSVLGYETLTVKSSKLFDLLNNTNKIYLKPKPISLEAVSIKTIPRVEKQIGSLVSSLGPAGYWRGEISLGGEIATRLRIKNKNTRLKELKIKILENLSDSVKVRINIYDFNKKSPSVNLLNSNIFHTISIDKGIEVINLKPYNITLNNDVIVSVEAVEFFGTESDIVIGAKSKRGFSYLRDVSLGKWKLHKGVEMNYKLLVSYPKKNNDDTFLKRLKPSKITLLWDTSASMKKDRELDKEIDLISSYLKAIKNETTVEVIKFNTTISSAKSFKIEKGDTNKLVDYLRNTNFDGGTDYSNLNIAEDSQLAILVSDGEATLSNFDLEPSIPFFCISSNKIKNDLELQNLAYYSNGHYINLKKNTIESSLNFMLKEIEDNEIYNNESLKSNAADHLYGKIYDTLGPVQGAKIKIKNSFKEVLSDAEGFYSIPANYKDIIKVSRLGMKTKEILVPREKRLDIKLDGEGILLDTITLNQYVRDNDPIKITGSNTPSSSKITRDKVKISDLYMADLLRRIPGIKVTLPQGSRELATYSLIRNIQPIPPLFLVNGGPIGNINDIDPQTVESVVVLKSLAETNIYGSQGAGGVIKITTKKSVNSDKQKTSSALIAGNDYQGNNIPLINNSQRTSKYINGLFNASKLDVALALYEDAKKDDASNSIPFYIEASDYFLKWDKEKAYVIVSSIADVAYDNPKALKTLAYKLEEMDKLEQAKHVYERIAQLRPNEAQSYRDLAFIYQETGEYDKATRLYKQMITNSIDGVDFKGLEKTITSELRHLIAFNKSKIDYQDFPDELLRADFKQDIRVVFEWNDPNTEFSLQFVNPNKKYFVWNHTLQDNKERLINEIETGFFTQEFIIDDSDKGEWLINIEYLSEEELINPTFLKYTVYRNYGLKNQTKELKVLKLYNQKQKVTIDKLLYN